MKFFSKILCVMLLLASFTAQAQNVTVGLLANMAADPEVTFKKLHDAGFKACQTGYNGNWTQKDADRLKELQAAAQEVIEAQEALAVEKEALEATKEDIAEAVAVIARQNRMTVEQLKPYVDAEFEAAVVRSVLTSKAMKLVRDSAEITEIQG